MTNSYSDCSGNGMLLNFCSLWFLLQQKNIDKHMTMPEEEKTKINDYQNNNSKKL